MKAELLILLCVATSSTACAARRPPVIVEQHDQVNLSDIELAGLMATHHRAVMDIALMDGGRGKSPELTAFATTVWQSRSRDVPAWEMFGGHAPKLSEIAASHQREMLDAHRSNIAEMKAADPPELDQLFIRELRRLSQVALDMIAQTKFQNAELKKLAERFGETQRVELRTLDQLQKSSSARR